MTCVYKTFMFEEINSLLRIHNKISDVVLNHQKNFECVVKQATTGQFEQSGQSTNNANRICMIHIPIQKWLSEPAKRKQFFFTLDVHSLEVAEGPRKNVSIKTLFDFLLFFNFQEKDKFFHHLQSISAYANKPSDNEIEKLANIYLISHFDDDTFIAFSGDKQLQDDNQFQAQIKHIQSECSLFFVADNASHRALEELCSIETRFVNDFARKLIKVSTNWTSMVQIR